jgi:phenylalanine-4-hydroxylase
MRHLGLLAIPEQSAFLARHGRYVTRASRIIEVMLASAQSTTAEVGVVSMERGKSIFGWFQFNKKKKKKTYKLSN